MVEKATREAAGASPINRINRLIIQRSGIDDQIWLRTVNEAADRGNEAVAKWEQGLYDRLSREAFDAGSFRSSITVPIGPECE